MMPAADASEGGAGNPCAASTPMRAMPHVDRLA
jgi:hypothetical protein